MGRLENKSQTTANLLKSSVAAAGTSRGREKSGRQMRPEGPKVKRFLPVPAVG